MESARRHAGGRGDERAKVLRDGNTVPGSVS